MELGEAYAITEPDRISQYEVVKVRRTSVVLREYGTNNEKPLTATQFHLLHQQGLIRRSENARRSHRVERMAFMHPSSARRKIEQRWLDEAKTLKFFIDRFDEEGWASRSDGGLEDFILRHRDAADALGFIWEPLNFRHGEKREWPSPSALRRANALGEPGQRTLADFYDERGKHSDKDTWDPFVLECIDKAVERYWAKRVLRLKHFVAMVKKPALREQTRRNVFYGIHMRIPDDETIRRRLHASMTRDRFAQKYGNKAADRVFDGYTVGMTALGPGHIVQLDHSWLDTWLVIKGVGGKVLTRRRAYYCGIVDVYSGGLVASIISWEPPSIETLAAAVKQMIRPKHFLRDPFYGVEDWAVWMCCMPKIIVLDNGKEALRGSFQLACDSVGIELDVAPLGRPKYKALIERVIEAVNSGIWHMAPGAVPFKPHVMAEADLCPELEAEWTLEFANKMQWKFISSHHHMDVSRTRHMSRGQKWLDGIAETGQTFLSQEQLDYVDQAFGLKKENVTLDNEGLQFKGHKFGFDAAVTGLLEDLLPASKIRVVRGKTPKRGSVKVDITWYADDCSYVSVYNRKKKKYVKLFNRDPLFRKHPCAWNVAKAMEKFFDARNEKFESADKRYARLVEFVEMLEAATERPTKELPHAHRLLEQVKQSSLVDNGFVETIADPSPSGRTGTGIAIVLAGAELAGDVQISQRPRVGGRPATAKATATRRRNRQSTIDPRDSNEVQRPATPKRVRPPTIDGEILQRTVVRNHEEYVLSLMDDLD